MKKLLVFTFTIFSCYLLFNCGNIDTEEQKKEDLKNEIDKDLSEAKEDLGSALDNIGEAFKGLKKKHNIESKDPISFREIKKMMPSSLAGFDLQDTEGQTTGALGFKISTLEATYEEDNDGFKVTVVDVAGVGSLVKNMANWSEFEVDKEGKNGYERTTTIDGHPALEKYNKRRERGEINILVENRFIISVKGEGISESQLQDAVEDLNLRKLARLAN